MDRWFSGGWLSGGWLAGGSKERKEDDRPCLDETISSELFAEGKGDEEKSGLKDNDSDCAKGPACLKEEENKERIPHLQGPDVDGGLEENVSDGKFIERLKVVADNRNKEWESTKIPDVDRGLEENASDGKFIERLKVVADNQNKEWESTKIPDVDRGLEENASDGKFIERLKVVADNQNKEWESTSPREVEWVNKYPQRSNEPDCMYYVRTGNCRNGANCKFNHHSYIDEQARPLNTLGPEKAASETIKEVQEWVRQKEFKAAGETIKEVSEWVRQKEFKAAGETIKKSQKGCDRKSSRRLVKQ